MASFKVFSSAVLLLFLQNVVFGDALMAGGFSEPKEANDYIKKMVNKLQPLVEAEEGEFFEGFEAISYSSQVVAGVNYWVKVKYNGDEYMRVKIHVPLPHTQLPFSLVEYEKIKSENDSPTPVFGKRSHSTSYQGRGYYRNLLPYDASPY